jgi:hypothetical protein
MGGLVRLVPGIQVFSTLDFGESAEEKKRERYKS